MLHCYTLKLQDSFTVYFNISTRIYITFKDPPSNSYRRLGSVMS